MESYLSLGIAALLPVVAAVIFFLLDRYTPFKDVNKWIKQAIYGVIFGGLAIVGTHWGIPMNGAVVNSRDSCAIIAGLFFGWPAGIIAGLIGGLERYFGVYWFGLGSFTQIACSVSTFIAGLAAAVLRKFMFKDKRAGLFPAFLLGIVIEVFHLFMVFVTNSSDYLRAFGVVEACTIPMVVANGLSVLIAGIILDVLDYKKDVLTRMDKNSLNSKFQFRMGVVIVISFLLSSTFIYLFQTQVGLQETETTLLSAIDDTTEEVKTVGVSGSLSQRVGDEGFIAVYNNDSGIVALTRGFDASKMKEDIGEFTYSTDGSMIKYEVNGTNYYLAYDIAEASFIVAGIPVTEADLSRNIAIVINTFLEIIIFGLIFIDMFFIVTKIVDRRLEKINNSLAEITKGNLNTVVDGGSTTEFKILSKDINTTVDALKGYIEQAKEAIAKDLALAKDIQFAALPHPIKNRTEFDIHAYMQTAKEVGGDFYDYYYVHRDLFTILIADVSGKGIPAAMFMMRAKTELKTHTQSDLPIAEAFSTSNDNLCKGNEAGMFVTGWQANIDLKTGVATFVNAGHNPPLIKHAFGTWEYFKSKPNMVLASFDGYPYHSEEVKLKKGDTIFLYTDGVTESINSKMEQYGEDRLLKFLRSKAFDSCEDITKGVLKDVTSFVGEAEQFDDITMLAFTFNGVEE